MGVVSLSGKEWATMVGNAQARARGCYKCLRSQHLGQLHPKRKKSTLSKQVRPLIGVESVNMSPVFLMEFSNGHFPPALPGDIN